MANHIYFVPREGTTNNNSSTDECLLVIDNRINPLRDRVWSEEPGLADKPFSPGVKYDRDLTPRVYLGVDLIFVEPPLILDAFNSSPPARPINTAEVIVIDDLIAIYADNFIERT